MGDSTRPGTVVVREIEHPPFEVTGVRYYVQESVWNGIDGRSYDLIRSGDQFVITKDESFDAYPDEEQITAAIDAYDPTG